MQRICQFCITCVSCVIQYVNQFRNTSIHQFWNACMFNMFCLLQSPPFNVISGDAEGVLRLWDLHTGTCLHKVKVHEATVVALTSTPRYMVSSGLDDRLCIVDRKRGTLVHELDMVMFTNIQYTIDLFCRNLFNDACL